MTDDNRDAEIKRLTDQVAALQEEVRIVRSERDRARTLIRAVQRTLASLQSLLLDPSAPGPGST